MPKNHPRDLAAACALTGLALVTPASAEVPRATDAFAPLIEQRLTLVERRTCPLGQHYSSYYRRCTWWLPTRG